MSVCIHGFACVIAGQWNQHSGGEHCRQRRSSSSIQGEMHISISADMANYKILLAGVKSVCVFTGVSEVGGDRG